MQRFPLLAIAALGLVACQEPSSPAGPDTEPTTEASPALPSGEPIPGQYIVAFRTGVGDVNSLARSLARKHAGKLNHTYQAALKGMAIELSDTEAEALRKDPSVLYVEQDRVVRTSSAAELANSPVAYASAAPLQPSAPWGLDRIDQRSLPLNGSYQHPIAGADVQVYIISSGIRLDHTEFDGRASLGTDLVGGGGDCHGQGTHMAGVVGGRTYGVAKAAGLRLVAVRVLDCVGSTTVTRIIQGIDWVTANRVLPAVATLNITAHNSQPMIDAVNNSIAAGVTYAIGGGSWGSLACSSSPANAANAITVGASNSTDGFVNYASGACIDIFAPGFSITSAGIASPTATNTFSSAAYAAAHVAGAAALFLSANPGAAPAQVAAALTGNATLGALSGVPAGTANRLLYMGFLNPWTTLAPMPTARHSLALAAANSRLYAIGGTRSTTSGTSALPTLEVYDPGTDSWLSRARMPAARYGMNDARHINGTIYVPGGRNPSGVLTKSLFAYHIASNTWSTKKPMPTLSGCGGSGVIGGQLYVVTFCSASTGMGTIGLHRYAPSSNSWTARAQPPRRQMHAAVAQLGGRIYVAGGFDGPTTYGPWLSVYDAASNSWSSRADMPQPRVYGAAQAFGGKIYVLGGRTAAGTDAAMLVYDPATNVWSTGEPMPTARHLLSTSVIAGKLYAVGGVNNGIPLATVERYAP
jgi:Subtilase family/Peptidase inhibitor I9/Kelch motif/Galactose oxidase, central domain